MTEKKNAPARPPPRPRKSTIEVDLAWLEQLPEAEKPVAKPSPSKPSSPPGVPASKGKGRTTIPVQSQWLIPPVPAEARGEAPEGARSKAPSGAPRALTAKPRGKLPPPLPREEREDDAEE